MDETLIGLMVAVTEKVRGRVPEKHRDWALPLVALAVGFAVAFLNEAPMTIATARMVVYSWGIAIGLTAAVQRVATSTKPEPVQLESMGEVLIQERYISSQELFAAHGGTPAQWEALDADERRKWDMVSLLVNRPGGAS